MPLASAQSANRSQLVTWVAMVRGAPEDRTSCLKRATSAWDKPFSLAVSSSSFENVPAFRPISSNRAAHFQRAAFSWSSSGVAEGVSELAFKKLPRGVDWMARESFNGPCPTSFGRCSTDRRIWCLTQPKAELVSRALKERSLN